MMDSVTFNEMLIVGAALIFLSVVASKLSQGLGIPALALFILIGMLAGSEGPGGIYWDNPELVQFIGIAALAFILFSGGLDTRWRRVKPVVWPSVALATIGVTLTAGVVSLFATFVLNFSVLEGLLLGAIMSSTDAAAVFSVLRSRSVRLHDEVESTLELESGSNDPMAVLLTTAVIQYLLTPAELNWSFIPMFIQQMGFGLLAGVFTGFSMVFFMNRLKLETEGLYYVMTIAAVMFSYGMADAIGGNGFLSVYVAGITMGNRRFVQRIHLRWFHDGLAWMMQIIMFLILGLQVFPSRLVEVAPVGLAISLFLMFVARPIAVYLVLWPTRFNFRQTTLVAWVGLRGAVPIILGTFPIVAGIPQADYIFNLVFFVVLSSVLIQGTSIPVVTKLLKLEAEQEPPYATLNRSSIGNNVTEVVLPRGAANAGKALLEIDLPENAKVLLVRKGPEVMESRGSLVLDENDRVLLFGDPETLARARQVLEERA